MKDNGYIILMMAISLYLNIDGAQKAFPILAKGDLSPKAGSMASTD